MEKFITSLIDSFKESFKRNKNVYFFVIAFVAIGVIFGIVFSFTIDDVDSFLSVSDKNYLSYLKGSADLSSLFMSSFKDVFIASVICTICSFIVFTLPIALLYLSYQSAIMILSVAAVISKYKFIGLLNSIVLILPFNLVLILYLGLLISNIYSFCYYNSRMNKGIFYAAYDKYIIYRLLVLIAFVLAICLVLSFVVPFLLKSLIIVSY